MSLDKILIEYAKLHLNLIQANETIALLQQTIKEMTKAPEPAPKSE